MPSYKNTQYLRDIKYNINFNLSYLHVSKAANSNKNETT